MAFPLPPQPDGHASDREMLEGFLAWYRTVVVRKVDGLPRDLAVRPMSPSSMSALGVLQHLKWVERGWSRRAVLGDDYPVPWSDTDPDADFRIREDDSVESVVAAYLAECDAADAIWRSRDLDEPWFDGEQTISVRWILVHMLEETARHAGHLDLIAEQLDGRTED